MNRTMPLVIACLLLGLAGGPAVGQGPSLAALNQLDAGKWELRVRGDSAATEQVCLGDPRRLIQLRHPGLACEQVIVEDLPGAVTVQYTCRGKGYGRTSIRRESSRLVQVDSQGIAGGLPYAFAAEGRRVGDCTS